MILSHYSRTPFKFNPDVSYTMLDNFKPTGFWLSDDTDFGWHKWCTAENWGLGGCKFRTDFKCDLSNWLVLKTPDQIRALTDVTQNSLCPEQWYVKWPLVHAAYSGILITPYQWECRFNPDWYHPWYCASACVWNLDTIKIVKENVPVEELMKEEAL